ncbi:MAG: glycogen debranching enzyme N-terminal domain-containing protein [Thermoanaerobaculia bacterium]
MSIQLDREITQDFERAAGIEWLEPNGLGGWAGTTVAGAHSRRHHGLLVAATQPPGGRTVLLSRLDETLHVEGRSFDLGCNQFPGAVAPRGFEYMTSFRKDLFPTFEYEAGGVRLRKTVAAVDGENTTLVTYEVLEAPGPFILSLRPFLAARDENALASANPAISEETPFDAGVLRLRPYPDVPEVFVQAPGADFRPNPQWWYRFEYEGDRRRGFDFQEDLWTPGIFGRELAPGQSLGIVISTRDPAGRDAFALFEKERKRREKIARAVPVQDDFALSLALAADRFVVRRGPQQRTVVARYPGAGESSLDAMIALPGLCLVTGRHEDAKKILRTAAKGLDKGQLDASADAALWMSVAAWKYLQATGDDAFVREALLPALRKVAHWYGSREDKAVEVNVLWFNALSILAELEGRLGEPEEALRRSRQAKQVQKRFLEAFWNEEAGVLQDGPFRPEAVFALSLPFPLLPKPKAARLLAALEKETIEPWLLGAYFTALVKVHGAAGRKKALLAVEDLKPRLTEAGWLTQAVTVAELLRAYVEDLAATKTTKKTARRA